MYQGGCHAGCLFAETVTEVVKVGNQLAVCLPETAVASLGLEEGDHVAVRGQGRMLEIERKSTVEELFTEMRKLRGLVPAEYKFSRDDAYDES